MSMSGTELTMAFAVSATAVLVGMALVLAVFGNAATTRQGAKLERLEKTIRTMCSSGLGQKHYTDACAQMSLPIKYPETPFNVFIDKECK